MLILREASLLSSARPPLLDYELSIIIRALKHKRGVLNKSQHFLYPSILSDGAMWSIFFWGISILEASRVLWSLRVEALNRIEAFAAWIWMERRAD